ncbi:putative 28S rRNA (cytosine(4447)-C(5))-methyltransferase [Sigmodon hispidus]
MGHKLDPTKKNKRGPSRKVRKQKGAETELVRFLPTADGENVKRLSSRARKRAAKRRSRSVEVPKPNKSPGTKTLPGELSKGIVQARVILIWLMDDYGADPDSEGEEGKLLPIERAALKEKAREAAAGGQWSEEETDEEEDDGIPPESCLQKDDKAEGDLQINVEDVEAFVLPPAGEMEQDAQAPDLQSVHERIQDIVGVLRDFGAQREEGRSRSEYLNQLQKDLATCYSYGDFLLGKLMELFPLSELIEFLEANEVPRPVTLRTNTLKTRRRDLAQADQSWS